jgi:hypothetical protein
MASATRDVDEVMKMFPTTYSVLVSVAAFEAAWGFYMLCCTKGALAAAIGRHLEVGSKASPALEPALSYAGGLRLAVALTILVAVTTPYVDDEDFAHLTHRLAVAAIVHTCILQPYMAACRSAPRIPTACWMFVSLVEGAVLTASLAAESNFDLVKLANYHVFWFFHAAYVCLAVGFVLSVWASGANCCCAPTDKVELSGIEIGSGDLAAPLFDENRHQLSPSSRRLLS